MGVPESEPLSEGNERPKRQVSEVTSQRFLLILPIVLNF